MRKKMIREAVVGAILVTFIFAAAPVTARNASPSPLPVPGSLLTVLASWFSAWTGGPFERAERPSEVRGRTKTGSSATSPATSSADSGNGQGERGGAIDPWG